MAAVAVAASATTPAGERADVSSVEPSHGRQHDEDAGNKKKGGIGSVSGNGGTHARVGKKPDRKLFAVLMQHGRDAAAETDALRREVTEAKESASKAIAAAREDAVELVQVCVMQLAKGEGDEA